MDTIETVLQLRPCDLNSLLTGKAAYKWQRASKETKELVWARLRSHVMREREKYVLLGIKKVQGFIEHECDDIFYAALPVYTVQAFTADGHNRTEHKFSGPGAYQQALWFARCRLADSARVTISTEREFKG